MAFSPYYRADDGLMAGKMKTFYHQAVDCYKDFQDRQHHQYITRKLTQLYHRKQPSVESADNEDIDSDEGHIVDVPAGEAVHSQSFTMSGDEEEEESAAPAAAAAVRLQPLPPLSRLAAMARDRLPLVGRSMPE